MRFHSLPRAVLPRLSSFRSFSSVVSTPMVKLERRENGVAIITFANPTQYNAMNVTMGEEFEKITKMLSLETLGSCINDGHVDVVDTPVQCVIVTGEGAAFSAGGDLQFLHDRCLDSPANNAKIMLRFYQRFLSILDVQVPVIAAINGPCVGAGLSFASACDIRIASPHAKMGFTFSKLGLHPGMGCTHTLPQIVGQEKASKLLLTGDLIDGKHALLEGLISQTDMEPLEAAVHLADRIVANSPVGIGTLTNTLRVQKKLGLETSLLREAQAQAICYASEEMLLNINNMIAKSADKKK